MTSTLTSVPTMRTTVAVHEFGGQYWDERDLTLTVSVDIPAHQVRLEVTDTLDIPRINVHLTAEQAQALYDGIENAPSSVDTIGDHLSLEQHVTVTLGDTTHGPYVRALPLAQLSEWLPFALGHAHWDGGDTWDY